MSLKEFEFEFQNFEYNDYSPNSIEDSSQSSNELDFMDYAFNDNSTFDFSNNEESSQISFEDFSEQINRPSNIATNDQIFEELFGENQSLNTDPQYSNPIQLNSDYTFEQNNTKRKNKDSIDEPKSKKTKSFPEEIYQKTEDPGKIHVMACVFNETKHLVEGFEFGEIYPHEKDRLKGLQNYISTCQIGDIYSHEMNKKLGYPLENVKENSVPFLKLAELMKQNSKVKDSFEKMKPFLEKRKCTEVRKGHNGVSDLLSLDVQKTKKFWDKLCLNKTTFHTMSFHFFEDKVQFDKFVETKKKRIRPKKTPTIRKGKVEK